MRVFPFDQLPRVGDLATGNAIARWLAVTPRAARLEKLVGGAVSARWGDAPLDDPFAAACDLRVGPHTIVVRGSSPFVRWLAQTLLSGVEEVAASRALTEAEHAIWVLFVATAVEDLGIEGEVWERGAAPPTRTRTVTLHARLAGHPCTIELLVPTGLIVSAPPVRVPAWADRTLIAAETIVGRCTLDRSDLARLRARSIVTLDPPSLGGVIARLAGQAELVFLDGAIGIVTSAADPLVARVATEYIPRAMALPDDARIELTVGVGATTLSLRQAMGLAIGEVVKLGRPLAGPFEIRAAGTLIGQGELVDVDGELGVRIVSLAQE